MILAMEERETCSGLVLQALAQLVVLQVVVGLVSEPLVLLQVFMGGYFLGVVG